MVPEARNFCNSIINQSFFSFVKEVKFTRGSLCVVRVQEQFLICLHCSVALFIMELLVWHFLRARFALGPLTKFLLPSFTVLGEGRKPDSCDNLQSMPQIGVFGWSKISASLWGFLWMRSYFGKRLDVWLLFGVQHMGFLERFLL